MLSKKVKLFSDPISTSNLIADDRNWIAFPSLVNLSSAAKRDF